MNAASDLQVGRIRPDGTRPVTGTDAAGLLLRGEVGPEPSEPAHPPRALVPEQIARLAGLAGRAPSVHNTQPWRLRVTGATVDLLADPARQLREVDPAGREMLISCGAALFGVRIGLRALGLVPTIDLLPAGGQPHLVARVRVAGQAAISRHESELVAAAYHRHTHRGWFDPGEVPARLVDGLRADASSEGVELVVLRDPEQVLRLAELVRIAAGAQAAVPQIAAELHNWMRPPGSAERDGIPASARASAPVATAATAGPDTRGWLPQRDFGEPGTELAGGSAPPVTAILTSSGDTPADWIRAGQALHRILLHAATRWVFASLQTQPLELAPVRAELAARLQIAGYPQMILQLGRSNTAGPTPRRPVVEILA
jgi:hypothetical protein